VYGHLQLPGGQFEYQVRDRLAVPIREGVRGVWVVQGYIGHLCTHDSVLRPSAKDARSARTPARQSPGHDSVYF